MKKRLLSFLIVMFAVLMPTELWAQEAYVVLSEDSVGSMTLTFYYDENKENRGGLDIEFNMNNYNTNKHWDGHYGDIKMVSFDSSFANYTTLTSTAYWFAYCQQLEQINGLEYLNTINVTDMDNMFWYCSSLKTLDVSMFKTDNVTDMSGMFRGSYNLESLDLSSFNTSKVKSFKSMFAGCRGLKNLIVPFDTSNATDLYGMFTDCSGLTSLDVSSFKTDKVTDMSYLFNFCSSLTTLDVSNFNTENVTKMHGMFGNCSGLLSLKLTNFNTGKVTDMGHMFSGCTALTGIDLSTFNTESVESMVAMFQNCKKMSSIDVSGFKTDNVTDMSYMFNACNSLASINVSGFKTDKVTTMSGMFQACSSLTNINVSTFNTTNVGNMGSMFSGCSGLTSLDVSNFNAPNLMTLMSMFSGCIGISTLNLSGFNTKIVSDMSSMFNDCSALTQILVGNEWSTAGIAPGGGDNMFTNCTNLVGGAGTIYDANHVDYTYAHIDGGSSNPGYFTEKNAEQTLNDGDLFTAETIEGVMLTYRVISAADKTCQLGGGDYEVRACDVNTTGTVTVPEVAKGFQVTTVGGYAFYGCSELTQITLPETIKTITYFAFFNCSGLTSFTIPNSVTRFDGNHQWNGCTGLTSIHIPANVTSMGNHTFANCPNILEVTVDENNPVFESPVGSHAIINKNKKSIVQGFKNTVIPEGITYIESAAFVGNEYHNIELPNSFEGFYWDAFEYNAVQSITVAEGNTLFDSRNNCNALMETATDKLVKGCANTVIPSETKVIGEYAFLYAYESNDYPSLKTVVLPEGLTKIENMAFGYCNDLEKIIIPSTVTEIMWNAFVGSDNLKTIISYIQEPFALGDYAFDDTQCQNIILYVPQGTKSLYEATEGWNQFKNILEIESSNAEAYVVLSGDGTGSTLTFYYDDQKENREGWMPMGQDGTNITWTNYAQGITNVIFDESFASCRPTSTAYWFSGFYNLVNIEGIEYLKTDSVTNMSGMFSGCSGLTSLDLSGFNTANVTDMSSMFVNCSALTSLDLSSFNTSNVTDMQQMFRGVNLPTLPISGFNTSKVTTMSGMFVENQALASIDISHFDTSNVTDMSFLFNNCHILTDININGLNTSNVTNMSFMFNECYALESVDVSGLDTKNVENMEYMFAENPLLKTIYVGEKWTTASVTQGDYMFYASPSIVGGAGTTFDADHVDVTYAHIDGGPSNPGYFTDKNAPVELPNVEYSFGDNGVLWVESDVTMAQVLEEASKMHNVAEHITAIVWHSSQPLTNSDLQEFDNPNMLIYVASDSLAPQNRYNVVVGDFAKNIVLKDVESGNGNFYCPQAFTAEMISYTHEYKQKTEVGVSRGWETIALPFDVQTVMHEKNGLIAPFGNSTSDKHFWLRQLTHQGLEQATAIQANWPYLISMPNSETYTSSYNLAGRVTFSAQNVVVPETEEYGMDMYSEAGGMVMMRAAFSGVSKSAGVYALNVGEARGNNPEGSVFEVNYRDIRPFEAYTIHEGNGPAPQFIPVAGFTDGEATGIEDVRSLMSDDSGETWYDLNGRKLQQKPIKKGVYIQNGSKVVIK